MKKTGLALIIAGSMSLTGCGLADLIDNAKASVEDLLSGALEVSEEGFTDILGKATKGFAAAGGQLSNMEAGGNNESRASNTGRGQAPEYTSLQAPTEDELEKCSVTTESNAGDSAVEDYSKCDNASGKIAYEYSVEGSIVKFVIDFEEYTEGVSSDEEYYYIDGKQIWKMSNLEGGGMSVDTTNDYTTQYQDEGELVELTLKDSLKFTFQNEGLTIDGSTDLTEGLGLLGSAELFFVDVQFGKDCTEGPKGGSIKMEVDSDNIAIEITECGKATLTRTVAGEETTRSLAAEDLKKMLKDLMANIGELMSGLGHSEQQVDHFEDNNKWNEAYESCTAEASGFLKPYSGLWCEGFREYDVDGNATNRAWVNCMKICDVDTKTTEISDYFMRGGLGTIKANATGEDWDDDGVVDMTADITIDCLDGFIAEHGVLTDEGTGLDEQERAIQQIAMRPFEGFNVIDDDAFNADGPDGPIAGDNCPPGDPCDPAFVAPGDGGATLPDPMMVLAVRIANGVLETYGYDDSYGDADLGDDGFGGMYNAWLFDLYGKVDTKPAACTDKQWQQYDKDLGFDGPPPLDDDLPPLDGGQNPDL